MRPKARRRTLRDDLHKPLVGGFQSALRHHPLSDLRACKWPFGVPEGREHDPGYLTPEATMALWHDPRLDVL